MTDHLKQLLEAASEDPELREKIKIAQSLEEIVELAHQKGLDFTIEDIQDGEGKEPLASEDLEVVTGGGVCVCVAGGGGRATRHGQHVCACVLAGMGDVDCPTGRDTRCFCTGAGGGKDKSLDDYY